jgi:phosphatidylglycerophosphate synthase
MLSIANSLSFLRAPLALLFLYNSPLLRITAIILAALTDAFDGYFARKTRSTTRIGALLDPFTDKLFVAVCLATLLQEGRLSVWEGMAMLSRDVALCIYASLMAILGRWKQVLLFRSIKWGKVATSLQFLTLIALALGLSIPTFSFFLFIPIGIGALFELLQISQPQAAQM